MRQIILGLTLSLVGGFAATSAWAQMSSEETRLYEAAKSEQPASWYVSHYPTETCDTLASAFAAKYPGLSINVLRSTGQVAYQRVLQELGAQQVQVDIYGTADIGHYLEFKDKGFLAKYVPENFGKVVDTYRGGDPDGYFTNTGFAHGLFVYNTDKVKAEDVPKSWKDFIDPKWKDQLAIAHPGFSGSAGIWFVAMKQQLGDDFIEKLAANNPHIGRSLNDPITNVISGERMIGIANSNLALNMLAKGSPIGIVYPEEGSVAFTLPTAVMAASDSPNTARLFENFLLSVEANEILVKDYWEVLRPEVPRAEGSKTPEEIKTINLAPQDIVEGIPEVKDEFRDVFGI